MRLGEEVPALIEVIKCNNFETFVLSLPGLSDADLKIPCLTVPRFGVSENDLCLAIFPSVQ